MIYYDSVVNPGFVPISIYPDRGQFRSEEGSFAHVNRRFRDNQNRPYAVLLATTISLELSCFSFSRSSQAALIPSSATATAVVYDEAARSPLRLKPKASRVELVLPDINMSLFCGATGNGARRAPLPISMVGSRCQAACLQPGAK